jgi:exodeoxyribonuclease VII large subunit
LLNALSHRGVLARGFALVRDGAGKPLRQARAVSAGMQLDIEFSDGHVPALAQEPPAAATEKPPSAPAAERSAPAAKPRGRRGNNDSNQGSLFGA